MSIKCTWTPPATRESGRPIDPADIAGYSLVMRVEGAPEFTEIATPAATVREYVLDVTDPGLYEFQLFVIDTDGRKSKPSAGAVMIPDSTAPGAANFEVVLTGG